MNERIGNPVAHAANRPRRPRKLILRGAYYFFLTVAILALGYAGYVVVDAHAYQAREQSRFHATRQNSRSTADRISGRHPSDRSEQSARTGEIPLRLAVADEAYSPRPVIQNEHVTSAEPAPVSLEGQVLGELLIPRLNLRAIIVQGDSSTILQRAVGHLPETPLPGESGNVALAGHRDTFFRPLRHIRVGDAITLQTQTASFQYQVDSTSVVAPTNVAVLRPSLAGSAAPAHSLTLITCFPFDYLGSAPTRFIVHAREISAR